MHRAFLAVVVFALACLLPRAARVGLAGDYLDPVSPIGAQDEAVYASSAIHASADGDWLTPRFMGRMALYKPPLLVWMSGLAVRLAGISRLALRFPIALLCALGAGLVFWWAAEARSWQAGAAAVLLLAANHLWHVLGSMCLTDGLLTVFITAAMYCLFADPWLESRAAFWGYAGSVAAAILTKSVAGALPLGILALYWLLAPRNRRPAFPRMCAAAALALALAAPWFVYQALAHPRWFWTEAVAVEILGYGAGAPPQTSQETQALFYAMRLLRIDPLLAALALTSLPALAAELKRRSAPAVLLACWMGVLLAAVLFWQYRNVTYLLPLGPAAAILAASYGTLSETRSAKWLLALALVGFALKAATPGMPWGISFRGGTVVASAPLLSEYCGLGRANELVLVEPDDEMYSSVLPLPRVRYYLIGQMPVSGRYGMDFAAMGIVLDAAQFDGVGRLLPAFRRRLGEWGMKSTAPVGTMIVGSTAADLARTMGNHPTTDFFLPERYREAVSASAAAAHEIVPTPPGHLLLLARETHPAAPPKWSCNP
ncbi:MAG TPA: glycosyltransferase family 39 protein [Bryobacteraceae bacterium]|nr:glycosyltransferase family 39 protein [Bryobacteraceae bacterium]